MKSVQPKGEFCYHEGRRGHPFHCRAVEDERLWSALMVQVAEGDEHALTRLYDGTNRMVYGLALRILGDSSAAEDVTLEVYLQVWRMAKTYDPKRGAVSSGLLP